MPGLARRRMPRQGSEQSPDQGGEDDQRPRRVRQVRGRGTAVELVAEEDELAEQRAADQAPVGALAGAGVLKARKEGTWDRQQADEQVGRLGVPQEESAERSEDDRPGEHEQRLGHERPGVEKGDRAPDRASLRRLGPPQRISPAALDDRPGIHGRRGSPPCLPIRCTANDFRLRAMRHKKPAKKRMLIIVNPYATTVSDRLREPGGLRAAGPLRGGGGLDRGEGARDRAEPAATRRRL